MGQLSACSRTPFLPRGVPPPPAPARFMFSQPQDCEVWRVLTTTSDGGEGTQGRGVPGHQVLPIGGAQPFQALHPVFCSCVPFVWRAGRNGMWTRSHPMAFLSARPTLREEGVGGWVRGHFGWVWLALYSKLHFFLEERFENPAMGGCPKSPPPPAQG